MTTTDSGSCPLCGTAANVNEEDGGMRVDCPVCGALALASRANVERELAMVQPAALRVYVPIVAWRRRREYGLSRNESMQFHAGTAVVWIMNDGPQRRERDGMRRPQPQPARPTGAADLAREVLGILFTERLHPYAGFPATQHAWAELGCPGELAMRGCLRRLEQAGLVAIVPGAGDPTTWHVFLTGAGESEAAKPKPEEAA